VVNYLLLLNARLSDLIYPCEIGRPQSVGPFLYPVRIETVNGSPESSKLLHRIVVQSPTGGEPSVSQIRNNCFLSASFSGSDKALKFLHETRYLLQVLRRVHGMVVCRVGVIRTFIPCSRIRIISTDSAISSGVGDILYIQADNHDGTGLYRPACPWESCRPVERVGIGSREKYIALSLRSQTTLMQLRSSNSVLSFICPRRLTT